MRGIATGFRTGLRPQLTASDPTSQSGDVELMADSEVVDRRVGQAGQLCGWGKHRDAGLIVPVAKHCEFLLVRA